MKCTLTFFKSLSIECIPFFTKYQSSNLLTPFLFTYLESLNKNLMELFVMFYKYGGDQKFLILLLIYLYNSDYCY